MSAHPHTIDNGPGGEKLTFVAVRTDERGEYVEGHNSVAPGTPDARSPSAGGGVHGRRRHPGLSAPRRGGTHGRAGRARHLSAGRRSPFWNAGSDELRCSAYVRPPGNIEYFLGEIFASTRRNGGKRPGLFDASYLSVRYRSEFELLAIPVPVRRLVFPVVAAVGSLLGLAWRFAGAPEPVRRPRP